MARPLRVEYSGAFYHIINRGNAREKIFKGGRDREKFLEYIERAVEQFSIIIHAYCLMNNHYHLLIETPNPNLSKTIQWIGTSYVQYFNTKHKRSGHLFQARFKSVLIDADAYLTHLSRYIHLNPLKAKIVDNLSEYSWSSYPAYTGTSRKPKWLETSRLLSGFGKNIREAQSDYKAYVEGIDIRKVKDPSKQADSGFILGDSGFVEWVKHNFLSDREESKEIPQLRRLKPRVEPDTIVQEVSKEFNCRKGYIVLKGRKNNTARKVAIYLAKDNCGIPFRELGEYFGNVTGASITMTYNLIVKEIKINDDLRRSVSKLKKVILRPVPKN